MTANSAKNVARKNLKRVHGNAHHVVKMEMTESSVRTEALKEVNVYE